MDTIGNQCFELNDKHRMQLYDKINGSYCHETSMLLVQSGYLICNCTFIFRFWHNAIFFSNGEWLLAEGSCDFQQYHLCEQPCLFFRVIIGFADQCCVILLCCNTSFCLLLLFGPSHYLDWNLWPPNDSLQSSNDMKNEILFGIDFVM